MILSIQSLSGDENDLIRLARKMLNRTTSDRIISKQECMVECTDLPLTLCSEMIQTISITGSSKVYSNRSLGKQSLINAYMDRPVSQDNQSFSQFVFNQYSHVESAKFVPHFVGLNSAPCYPVSPSYARATLIIHSPWRNAYYHQLNDSNCLIEFHDRIKTCQFPTTVKLNYLQAKQRYEQSMKLHEPTMEKIDDSDVDEDDQFLLMHMTSLNATVNGNNSMNSETDCFNRGLDYDWSKRHTVSSLSKIENHNSGFQFTFIDYFTELRHWFNTRNLVGKSY